MINIDAFPSAEPTTKKIKKCKQCMGVLRENAA
jgi:hypothetical protein